MRLQGVIKYSSFFQSPLSKTPKEFIAPYPSDFVVFHLSRINIYLFYLLDNDSNTDQVVMENCFKVIPEQWKKKVGQIKRLTTTTFFTPAVIQFLMSEALTQYVEVPEDIEENDIDTRDFQSAVFEALLAANEIYYDQIDGSEDKLCTLEFIWKMGLSQQRYLRDKRRMLSAFPFKALLFIKFIEENYGEKVLTQFQQKFGIRSAYEFVSSLLGTIVGSMTAFEKDKQPRWTLSFDDSQKAFWQPFTMDMRARPRPVFSGNAHHLAQTPIFIFSEGAVILDFHYFQHLLEVALIHNFFEYTELPKLMGTIKYPDFLSIIGKKFYEEYTLKRMMQKIYTHPNDRLLSDADHPANPDIWLTQDRLEHYMMEMKACRLHVNDLESLDELAFKKFLIKNFATEKTSTKERNKGVFQLARHIKQLLAVPGKGHIYPIIVFSDPVLHVNGVNDFLDAQLKLALGNMPRGEKKVFPLTCISLDFFIEYYDDLSKGRKFLKNQLRKYHEWIRQKKNQHGVKKDPLSFLKTQQPFTKRMDEIYNVKPPSLTNIMKDFSLIGDSAAS